MSDPKNQNTAPAGVLAQHLVRSVHYISTEGPLGARRCVRHWGRGNELPPILVRGDRYKWYAKW